MSEPNQSIPIHDEMTIDQALQLLEKYRHAGIIKMVPRDVDDNVMGAVLVVSRAAVPEVLRLIDQLEERWEHENAEKTLPHSMR